MANPTIVDVLSWEGWSGIAHGVLGRLSPERSYPRAVVRAADLESGDHMLDVGCGTGLLLAEAAQQEPGAVLIGLDPDEDALEVAATNLSGSGARVELRQGLGEEIPFADATFDVVAATLVLASMPSGQRRRALGEIRRVLKPEGRLLVADWTEDPDGIEALAALPGQLLATVWGGSEGRGRLRDDVMLAGFAPPATIERFSTLFGTIDLSVAELPAPL